jgi:hypothetical protein
MASGRWGRALQVLPWLLVATGAVLRLDQYFLGRSLWLDEATGSRSSGRRWTITTACPPRPGSSSRPQSSSASPASTTPSCGWCRSWGSRRLVAVPARGSPGRDAGRRAGRRAPVRAQAERKPPHSARCSRLRPPGAERWPVGLGSVRKNEAAGMTGPRRWTATTPSPGRSWARPWPAPQSTSRQRPSLGPGCSSGSPRTRASCAARCGPASSPPTSTTAPPRSTVAPLPRSCARPWPPWPALLALRRGRSR